MPNLFATSALLLLGGGTKEALGDTETVDLDAVVVTASPFVKHKDELVVPASELTGEPLKRAGESSLGATLSGEPGVHSTYYGPGAGRPVIRGFDGDRIRILNQGTDSFDVSQTSPDHGVSIEPLFADDIEVVRGPASLLYGNAAIGGVVNVMGKELPRERALASFSGQAETFYGSVSDEKSIGLALQGGQGDFAWSAGFLDRQSNDFEIPGFAESAYQMEAEEHEHEEEEDHEHEEVEHDHDEEHGEEEEVFGVLENSFVDTRSGYLGLAWFGDRSSLAVSYSEYDSDYGVPGHSHEHGHEEEHEHEEGEEHEEDEHEEEHGHGEEAVTIDLDQSRFTLRGELIDPVDFLQSLELDLTFGDYRHRELEGEAVGTVFERDGYELRLTGVHSPVGDLTGAFGFQAKVDDFSAVGEEAFIPSSETSQYGIFAMERLNQDWGAWEFGARLESVEIDPIDASLADSSFDTVNASAGAVRRLSENSVVSANLVYAERAPNASELYAFGPHIGTRSFEIGDVSLGKESSTSLDLAYRLTAGRVTGEITGFYSNFSDYVYMRFLDHEELEDLYGELDTVGLDVFQATAVDAKFYGFEVDLRYHLIDEADRAMHVDLLYDQTRATNESFNTNLPRIPARRLGLRYEYAFGPWVLGAEGRWHDEASHIGPNQLPTDSYTLWGADARYRMYVTDMATVDLFVVGTNLSDEEARPHTSFLKDLAPMPGRSLKLGVRTSF
ncbi:TonB-dependent receptor [Pelagicoccus sp. SDUM812002]|uniref:TonB-dependent receptor n=1 Tax=Pelagicoccus sp. SDUM812002 TaxID=3041266 RepID=UPI0028100233|nr:TonB-dependent receptor [Pelagicoccus sp. SDUM812002]MDQ8185745.1 TonB-dependent receptor [Pelagicoccus sp. SDUM812002]